MYRASDLWTALMKNMCLCLTNTWHVQCKRCLTELSAAVQKGGGYVLGGRFTYADITMVAALNLLDFLGKSYTRSA